jgi:anti-sigma factor RsiW
MMNCKQTFLLLSDYIEETLAPLDRDAVLSHLQKCVICKHLVHTYGRTRDLCKEALDVAAPAELGQRLIEFLRKKTGS